MTVLDYPTRAPVTDEAQLLFEEARRRQKRRRLVSGIVATVLVLVASIAVGLSFGGATRSTQPPVPSGPIPAIAASSTTDFSLRPIVCFAPEYAALNGQPASTGVLPTCSASYLLTAANLGVATSTGIASAMPQPDPGFAAFPSTLPRGGISNATVLLPGASDAVGRRFVLGPAGLTASGISSASVVRVNGQWLVNLRLTGAGSSAWDTLAQAQFHALVAVVEYGHVISAPIIQPTQTGFTTFDGQLQLSGSFTEQQAKALAAKF